MKVIAKLQSANHPEVTILVRFDAEWEEFTASPATKVAGKWVIDAPATYHSDSKPDVLATASYMALKYRDSKGRLTAESFGNAVYAALNRKS